MPLNLVEESYSLFHNLKSKCLVNTRCSHIDIPEAPFLTIWVYHMVVYQRRRILLWNYWNLTECTVAAIDRYHHRRRPRPWPILVRLVRPISAQDGPCRGKEGSGSEWTPILAYKHQCMLFLFPFIHPSIHPPISETVGGSVYGFTHPFVWRPLTDFTYNAMYGPYFPMTTIPIDALSNFFVCLLVYM